MAYFIGYKEKNKNVPIDLDIKDILDLIKLTTSFNNKEELNTYLKEKGYINESKDFEYLIDKGPKGKKNYLSLPYNKIYYKEDEMFFNMNDMKEYVFRNINDKKFLNSLYAYYIKKIIGMTNIYQAINQVTTNVFRTKDIFNSLYKKTDNDDMKKFLKEFGTYFTQNRRVYGFELSEEYNKYVNNFMKKLTISDIDLVNTFEAVKGSIKEREIPIIRRLSNLYNNINEETITLFLNNVFYVYDQKTKEIKIDGDHLKFNHRGIVDLGAFLSSFNEYNKKFKIDDDPDEIKEEFEEEEKEEFLTDEDYELTNTIKPYNSK